MGSLGILCKGFPITLMIPIFPITQLAHNSLRIVASTATLSTYNVAISTMISCREYDSQRFNHPPYSSFRKNCPV